MNKAEQDPDRNGYKAPAVHKAFELLRAVAEAQGGARLVDLATRAGISASTAHGLVHALIREKALIQAEDGRRLFLGPLIADLAFTDWNYIKVNRLGQPFINTLRDRAEATVFLGVRVRGRIMITATAEARESFKISAPVGTTMPLCAGAVGKVFLAMEKTPEQLAVSLGEKGLHKIYPQFDNGHGTIPFRAGPGALAGFWSRRRGVPVGDSRGRSPLKEPKGSAHGGLGRRDSEQHGPGKASASRGNDSRFRKGTADPARRDRRRVPAGECGQRRGPPRFFAEKRTQEPHFAHL